VPQFRLQTDPMTALCSHTDAVSQCGFWGGVKSGWAEFGERWDWVAAQFVPGPGVITSDTAFLTVSGDYWPTGSSSSAGGGSSRVALRHPRS
jgi:hypothetical protein